VKPEVRTS